MHAPTGPGTDKVWDMNVCHTWFFVRYPLGNIQTTRGGPSNVWDGPNPPEGVQSCALVDQDTLEVDHIRKRPAAMLRLDTHHAGKQTISIRSRAGDVNLKLLEWAIINWRRRVHGTTGNAVCGAGLGGCCFPVGM